MSSQILSQNYSDTSLVAGLTASSEAAGFPKENVTNFSRRTKVWRSGGYFEIKAGENEITFEETDGVALNAVLTAGGYTSFSALATEIKTALETAGASSYTVIQDSLTLKARITSDLSGGGGIFNILWTSGAFVGDVLGYNTTTDDTGSSSYLADSLRISTGEFFLYDFGMGLNPDAVIVSWRQDQVNSINETAKLRVKANFTNNFTTTQFSRETSKTDFGFVMTKPDNQEGLADSFLRYWRLEFFDIDNPTGFIELGSIFIGDYIGFERGQIQIPFNAGWEDGSTTQISDGGQSISIKKFTTREFSAEWFALTREEKENFDDFFERVTTSQPFYVLIDPNQVLGSGVERYAAYVKFSSTPSWSMNRPGVFSVNCSFREDI